MERWRQKCEQREAENKRKHEQLTEEDLWRLRWKNQLENERRDREYRKPTQYAAREKHLQVLARRRELDQQDPEKLRRLSLIHI